MLSIVGDPADRIMVGATLASFVVLAAGLYRLAAASFGTLVGLAAAALLCTRFDFPFLAARAYIDIPYLAFVVWAAALEAERPRRGTVVLRAAGLRGAHAPGGMAAERPVLAVVHRARLLAAAHPLRGAHRRCRR